MSLAYYGLFLECRLNMQLMMDSAEQNHSRSCVPKHRESVRIIVKRNDFSSLLAESKVTFL